MSNNIVKKLTELKVDDSALLTVSYSEGADVWHINESHVEETVGETDTAQVFASLLSSGIPVYSQWGSRIRRPMRLPSTRLSELLSLRWIQTPER